MEGTLLEVNSN